MNERLEQEWKSYCDKQGTGTMISVNIKDVAEHFYNLALKDVRREVETEEETLDILIQSCDDNLYFDGGREACQHILSFIDNLT